MYSFPLLTSLVLLAAADPAPFHLDNGDRVVFIGSALIEREQRYGYWEAALTARFAGKDIRFRNLGWSGDTVFGEAQAGFGTIADGFRHLKDHVLVLKPTVIFVGYGANESFEGSAGLTRFTQGLETLLDALGPTKARFVLLSPTKQEDLGRPLPDPSAANRNLKLYAEAIRDVAAKRGLRFVDLFDVPNNETKAKLHLTDDQVHLTAFGYWRTASVLERGLGLPELSWQVHVDAKGDVVGSPAVKAEPIPEGKGPRFWATDVVLPLVAPSGSGASVDRILVAAGLAPGTYALTVDKANAKPGTVKVATADEWASGVTIDQGPEFEQAEKLRLAIVAKNRLYFHRWRPQNETYLFGFRKHEQGQNAREIPQFDPLVDKAETEIAQLAVPVRHRYWLTENKSK